MDKEELGCTKYKELINAHLPIPELNRKDANDAAAADDDDGDYADNGDDDDEDDGDNTDQEGGE